MMRYIKCSVHVSYLNSSSNTVIFKVESDLTYWEFVDSEIAATLSNLKSYSFE